MRYPYQISICRRLWLLSTLLLLTAFGHAQKFVSGEVTDQEGITIPSTQIILLDGEDIKGYTLSDFNGQFKIELPAEVSAALILEARMFGFASQSFAVADITGSLKISLKPEAIDIETVEVTADALPIAQREDTLMFNTASFSDGTEHKVEDMLKKLPGVDVDEDGQIKVQGKPIDRVLIDGDDTFGRNYRLATQNINAGFVNRVDVISNFTEDQLTGDLDQSKELVLDLKLENSKKKIIFGEVELAAGLPGGMDNDANVFMLSGKTKAILFAQNNTMGQDPSSGTDMSYRTEGHSGVIPKNRPDLLSTPTGLRPKSINPREYLTNEVYATAGSLLLTPNKNIRSRTIFSLDNNLFRLNNQERINFFNQDIPITVDHFKFYRESEGKVWLDSENNFSISSHSRLDFTFKGTMSQRDMSADLTSTTLNRSSNLLTRLEGSPNQYNSRLRFTRRVNEHLAVRLIMLTEYRANDQEANHLSERFTSIIPEASNGIRQNAKEFTLLHNPHVSVLYSRNNWFFDTKVGYRSTNGGVEGNGFALTETGISPINVTATNLSYTFTEAYVEQRISKSFRNFDLSYGYNLASVRLGYENSVINSDNSLNNTIFQPNASLEYKLSSRGTLSVNAAHRRELPAPNQLIAAPYFSDHQTLMTGLDTLYLQRSTSVGFRYRYNNSYRQLVYYVSAQRTSIPNGLQRALGVSSLFTEQSITAGFPSNSIQAQAGVSKFVSWLQGSLDISTRYFQFNNQLELDGQLEQNRFEVIDNRLRYNSSLTKWLKLSINGGYKRSQNVNLDSDESKPTLDQSFNYGSAVTVTIKKNTSLNAKVDGYTWKQNQQNTSTLLGSLFFRHTFPSGLSCRIEGSNLFNQLTFNQNYVNSFQVSQRSFRLRPRTILFGITWGF